MDARTAVFGCVCGIALAGVARVDPARGGRQTVHGTRVVLTIGTASKSKDEKFSRLIDVKVSAAGEIYALDNGDPVVKVFDSTGHFMRRIGRKGQGSGEFESPTALLMYDHELVVQQRRGWRESRFSLEGKHLRTDDIGSALWLRRAYPVKNSASVVEHSPEVFFSSVPTPAWRTVTYSSGTRADTLFRIRCDTVFLRRIGFEGISPVPSAFGASGAWALLGDSVLAYADGYAGAVSWYSFSASGAAVSRRDTLGRSGDAVLPQDVNTEAERQQSVMGPTVAVSMTGNGSDRSSGPVQIMIPPPFRSVATKALFSPDGTLWIGNPRTINARERTNAHPPVTWTAFPTTGRPFSIELPATFTLTAVRGALLFGYGWSAANEPVVLVYRVGES